MTKIFKAAFFLCLFFIVMSAPVNAYSSSSYVLPYPSSMPGSIFYGPRSVLDMIMKYWYFGNFGQFKYNLEQSDKYLVQGKTLFEYQQYLLAYDSIQKSNQYFLKAFPNLQNAKAEGKDISEKAQILDEASGKHIEELEKMKLNTPSVFIWTPEKMSSTKLQIHELLMKSIEIRKTE